MTRQEEINNLLLKYKEKIKRNPGKPVLSDRIYRNLEHYGLSKEELENNARYDKEVYYDLFNRYKNSDFDIIDQDGFIHFCNWGDFNDPTLKLYLSPKPEATQVIMEKVLDYISDNNIKTDAKIAHHDRSDSVILRITSIDDTKKVVDYINNDNYIIENVRKTNPLIMREGVVGIAYDDELSYNDITANIIAIYLNEKSFNQEADSISLQDFKRFIADYFDHTFVSGINTNNYLNGFSKDYKENRHKMFPTDVMLNHMHVINMIANSLSQKDSFEVVKTNFELSINEKLNKSCKKEFEKFLYDKQTKKTL